MATTPAQNQDNASFEENLGAVMDDLPPPVRRYLSSGQYTKVAKQMMATYSLHIDQAAVVERELMLLLMGIETPEEFSSVLAQDASLSPDVVRAIAADINQKVFIPLRDELRGGGTETVKPQAPPPVQKTPPSLQKPAVSTPVPLPKPTTPNYQPAQSVPKPAIPVATVTKPPEQSAPHTAPLPPKSALPRPGMKLGELELPPGDGAPAVPHEAAPVVARPAPPPPNLPGAMPAPAPQATRAPAPTVLPVPKPIAPAAKPSTPVAPAPQPAAPKTPYSVDPYREPVDDQS